MARAKAMKITLEELREKNRIEEEERNKAIEESRKQALKEKRAATPPPQVGTPGSPELLMFAVAANDYMEFTKIAYENGHTFAEALAESFSLYVEKHS